jgi:hypothetical protein
MWQKLLIRNTEIRGECSSCYLGPVNEGNKTTLFIIQHKTYLRVCFVLLYFDLTLVFRFDELSGRLNIDKFYQNTKFLDEYQEEEIATLQKKMNKTKSVDTKTIVKEELVRYG